MVGSAVITFNQIQNKKQKSSYLGFTIVELLIVVVVIAILAAITIVAYNGIANRAKDSSAQSGAKQGFSKIASYATQNDDLYPADLAATGLPTTGGTTYQYTVNNSVNPRTFCLSATVSNVTYYVTDANSKPTSGTCPIIIADGALMQTVTSANCPSTRIRGVDARDSHTYWVQKLADGKCWMLTNLAYAGGGTNTYSDTKALSNGTGEAASYTIPYYYVIPSTTNYTTEPTPSSASTSGIGQYGYLYNWCGAMGAQATAACSSSSTPAAVTSTSICPAGWRLPVGNGGEFAILNNTVNSGATNTDAGLLAGWLGQRSGSWSSGFGDQGSGAVYWSSTQGAAGDAYVFYAYSTYVTPSINYDRTLGFAVRCIAS